MRRFCFALALVGTARAATLDEGLALKRQEKIAEAEVVFAQVVGENPTDAAALEQWATVLGWLQRFDDSIAAWKRALEQKPDHPDYAMGLARVEYWKGDLRPARARMEALLQAAPDRADALALAGDICAAQGDLACARDDYRRALALAPSAELQAKLDRSADPLRWRFDAGGQVDAYNTDRGAEGSFFVQASWQAVEPLVLSGGYEQLRQFGELDHRLNFGAYLHPVAPLVLSARVAVSPTADTVAPWEASGGAELTVAGPVTALANVRHLDFPDEGVTIIGGGARLELGGFVVTAQGGVVVSTVNSLQGFGSGRVEYAFGEAWRVYYGFARGGQAQLLLPPEVATTASAGVLWQIERSWGVRLDYTFEAYGDIYRRHSVGSALTFKL